MSGLNFNSVVELVQKSIKNTSFNGQPNELYDPMNYILQLGGKRLRPVTTILAAQLFNAKAQKAIPAAKAVEIFHNFTLVHDDIMDKAPLRRGKATVHEKWNDNIAILSGDTLLVEAYNSFLEGDYDNLSEILECFNKAAKEVCEGQQLDMNFETRSDVTILEYLEMIKLKTSVLLGAALKIGALVAKASQDEANRIYDFGVNLGIAFQLQDDYLDCFGDPEKFGKQVGGDIISNKKTYMLLKALELDNTGALQKWIDQSQFDPLEKVRAVKEIYKTQKIDLLAFELMDDFYKKAVNELNAINGNPVQKKILLEFANQLMKRAS